MKFIYILASIALGMSFWSCSDDFLDRPDPTRLDARAFYETETQLEQAVNGVYDKLQDVVGDQWRYAEYIADNTTLHFNVADRGQGPSMEAIEYWQLNPSTSNVYNLYSSVYEALIDANITLQKLSGADIADDKKSNFEGQLKFIRAYHYFLLVQYFGDVIIVTEPIETPSEAWTFERSPVSEVYKFIESELNSAVSLLPSSLDASEVGRVSKGAALSLLGKVYLTQNNHADAVSTLKQVLSLGYSLLPDYSDVFDPNMKNHSESVLDIQYQGNNDLGEHNDFINNFYPLFSNGAVIPFPGANGGGWNIPTLSFIDAFEDGDLRKGVCLSEGYTDLDGNWVAVPFITKFFHDYSIEGRPDDNWPLIRYADVLLMLAEAVNEASGPTGEAYSYINPIRDRAGLAPLSGLDKESFRSAVLNERRIELAFENHRWFDLKRTMSPVELAAFLNAHGAVERANPTTDRGGIPFSTGDYIFEPYEVLFPIPADEISINSNLRQNDGY